MDKIIGALDDAESFLNGFEDDETQEGISEMIEAIQIARELHERSVVLIEAFIDATTTASGRPHGGFEEEVLTARELLIELQEDYPTQETP